jgi:hypothetical protein
VNGAGSAREFFDERPVNMLRPRSAGTISSENDIDFRFQ